MSEQRSTTRVERHSMLHAMLRSNHCRHTQQLFAIDAIPFVQTDAGRRLASWLLRYHNQYLTGATDPDTRICDYHNQILHVEEGNWGGAPRVAHQWYDRLQRHLQRQQFAKAATAAGILCHYFTDVLQPLHTGSTTREAIVHRPMEWSIYRSYDSIYRHWIEDDLRIVFKLSGDPGWLNSAMLHGARHAHQRYSLLVNSYRFDEGTEDPTAGLDAFSRAALAELFGLAITGWARVIERAAMDAELMMDRPLPTATVVWPTALAILRAPRRRWRRRIEHCLERKAIADLAKEFRRKGHLVKHLPDEVDIKRRVIQVRRDELEYQVERERWLEKKRQAAAHIESKSFVTQQPAKLNCELPAEAKSTSKIDDTPILSRGDSIFCMSLLGTTTATRMDDRGIRFVGQLLSGDPVEIARLLSVYWIDTGLVRTWQAQASLLCSIPGLRDVDAQLLAGAGFRDVDQIASSDLRVVYAEVNRFAITAAGRRCLAKQTAPNADDVEAWFRFASRVVKDRRASA